MPNMTKNWTPDDETAEKFATYRQAIETERLLKPDVRKRAEAALKAGATGTQLARLTGMTPEVFRRMARDLDLPVDPRYRERAEASRRKPKTAAVEQTAPEPNERPSPRPAPPVIPIVEPEPPRELPEPPWPAPLPSAKARATAVTAIVQWVLDLDEDTAHRLLDRARRMPSYADEWHMHAQSSGPDWAGLMVLHANQGAARKWLDEERPPADA